MTPTEIKAYYGGLLKFHKQTGIPASALMEWVRSGYVPYAEQCKIQNLTNGKLQAISTKKLKTYKTDNKNSGETKMNKINEEQLKGLERLSDGFHNNDESGSVDLISALAKMAYQAMTEEEV